ncbi:MAG TPA: CcmD family protein [bacterium]|nr:CcmD family protein [bacterium]
MTYLFWAFAVVWVGLFVYLYGLTQRSRRLEHELDALREEPRAAAPSNGAPR